MKACYVSNNWKGGKMSNQNPTDTKNVLHKAWENTTEKWAFCWWKSEQQQQQEY